MITYEKFKEIFDSLEAEKEPEVEISFDDRDDSYMIIKYSGYITFQRCGLSEDQSTEIKFNTLDDLYNSKTIDGIVLKDEWGHIDDIVVDASFSIVNDQENFLKQYGIML